MESIQNQAMETYQKNLEYFSKEQAEVAKLLNIFEIALNNQDISQNFDLEYIDGYFDIKDLRSQKYMYGADSMKLSKQFCNGVNFKKDTFTFEGFPIYNFTQEAMDNLDEDSRTIEGVLPIMSYYFENMVQNATMKSMQKFIFIGVGLGLHIPLINEKIGAQDYIIIEDNLEIFKLSLFTTKYYELATHANLYFSIADDENQFLKTMNTFLENNFFYNRHLKYMKFPHHSNNKIKQIQNALTSQSFIFFPYKATLFKALKPLEYLNDGFKSINVGTHLNESLFYEKPVLILAAGPSFQKHLEWVKENKERFIIVAVSAILNTLVKHDIKPQLVTHLDGSDVAAKHFDEAISCNFLEQTALLLGPNTPTRIRESFKKEQIFYYDEGTNYIKGYGSIFAPCIGSTSLILSLIFNTKELYLLGLDLAVNQETGETHASEHLYSSQNDMTQKDELSYTMEYIKNLFPVQGNFVDTVYTNSLLHSSVQSLYRNMDTIKRDDQNIYNLSEGAKIYKAVPTHIDEVPLANYPLLDKDALSKQINQTFTKYSTDKLSPSDVLAVKQSLRYAKQIKNYLQEYKNSVSHSNQDKYLYDLLGLVSSILHLQNFDSKTIVSIYFLFFKYALSIIIDFLNTKEISNEKRHIKKLDKMLQDEMGNIITLYIDTIEEFVNTRC